LNGHLKDGHGNILSGKVNAKVCSVKRTKSQVQHETIETFETHPDDPGPSTSKANIDESTENSDKAPIEENMTQNTFMSSFKRQKTINESFAFLNSFKEGGQKPAKIISAIMYMVCKDNQPLSMVEDKGFVHLMNVVAPNFKIPSRREISRRIFLLYDSMKNIFIGVME